MLTCSFCCAGLLFEFFQYREEPRLFICEFCLKYAKRYDTIQNHLPDCPLKHPPGTVIYNDTEKHVSVYEIDGADEKLYCQCLCLLSKLFIDHKTLYYGKIGN